MSVLVFTGMIQQVEVYRRFWWMISKVKFTMIGRSCPLCSTIFCITFCPSISLPPSLPSHTFAAVYDQEDVLQLLQVHWGISDKLLYKEIEDRLRDFDDKLFNQDVKFVKFTCFDVVHKGVIL